jgi:hypothetical protein
MRFTRVLRAGLATLAVGTLGVPATRAADPVATLPDAIYAASATGAGLVAFVDAAATGGAFYVANLSAPFAEATLDSGPATSAVASYAYDRNAATGLYYIVSSSLQAEGAPALPEIPNTAEARYPGTASGEAGTSREVASGPGAVGASSATATAAPGRADAVSRSAYASIAEVIAASAQAATSTVHVEGGVVFSDARSVVHDLSIAGVVTIGSVVGESHTEVGETRREVRTSFRIADAAVAGIPVTIGSDGVRAAGSDDPGAGAALADTNRRVRDALASAGITIRVLDAVTSEENGVSASTPGIEISVPIAPPATVPGGTVALVVGRSEAAGSFAPVPQPPVVVIPAIPPVPPTTVTITVPGSTTVPVTPGLPAGSSLVAVRRPAPALALFALWQLSAFGSVFLAWWRRERKPVR